MILCWRLSLTALAAVLLLSGCSSVPVMDAESREQAGLYQQRHDYLAGWQSWSLEGRLAVRDEADGGSGHFSWQLEPQGSRMDFHGALGRGAWNLVTGSDGAVLELADGARHSADTVDLLVRQQLGWQIPVDTLAWWVRGLAAPGMVDQRSLDDNGNLVALVQKGWSIDYGRYREVNGVAMPIKMTAKKADKSVKLAIRTWTFAQTRNSND